jgi:hypothetical protein
MSGLSPKHHAELNGLGVERTRFAELRGLYGHDDRAQRQIDVYDGTTEYHKWFRRYIVALKSRDQAEQDICGTWFRENGYEGL